MRKLPNLVIAALILASCTKDSSQIPTRNPINEPPSIRILDKSAADLYYPLDQISVSVRMTDLDLVAVASWEAVGAALACGPNQYFQEFKPMLYEFDMHFSFTIPPGFPGTHILRIYGVDVAGNIATVDIPYTVSY
jgi:hypothetical protein